MNRRSAALAAGAAFYAFLALKYSDTVSVYIRGAVDRCFETIIPSLYAFMIAAALFASTGASRLFGRLLSLPARIFGMNGELFFVFLISQIGGYPCGSIMLNEMLEQKRITERCARTMQYSCFGSGPAFLLGVMSGVNGKACLCVFLSCLTANLLLSLCMRAAMKNERVLQPVPCGKGSYGFTEAVCCAGKALVKICAMIAAFASVRGALSAAGAGIADAPVFASLWDISALGEYLGAGGGLFYAAGFFSFGGICVACQLFSICSYIKIIPFLAARFFCGTVSAALCMIYLRSLYSGEVMCISRSIQGEAKILSIIPSVILFIMTMLLLSKKGWTNGAKGDII